MLFRPAGCVVCSEDALSERDKQLRVWSVGESVAAAR